MHSINHDKIDMHAHEEHKGHRLHTHAQLETDLRVPSDHVIIDRDVFEMLLHDRDNNGWLPATEEFIKQLKTGDLVAYIDYKGTVGMLNWVVTTVIENWTATTKYMRVLDKPKEGKVDKFVTKLLSQFNADDQEAVLAMIKEEFGED